MANLLKGDTARFHRRRLPEPKRMCGRGLVRPPSVGTEGPVAAETIRRYIEKAKTSDLPQAFFNQVLTVFCGMGSMQAGFSLRAGTVRAAAGFL
jgi:hypothetical protein